MGNPFKSIDKFIQGSPIGGVSQFLGLDSLRKAAAGLVGVNIRDVQTVKSESAADKLAREEKESLEARRKAIAGLTQTSPLGAGTPQTARKSVLGV